MRALFRLFLAAFFLVLPVGATAVRAAETPLVPEHILGKPDAPVMVEEFVSLTCSHCADFYNNVLPELKTRYVDTGKVRFVLRDFPLDGVGLKAAMVARCMPVEQFYPFISVLYKNMMQWAFSPSPEQALLQFARLGGLTEEKGKACLADTKLMDAIVAGRAAAVKKYNVDSTPLFVINDGKKRMKGAGSVEEFAKTFDELLGVPHVPVAASTVSAGGAAESSPATAPAAPAAQAPAAAAPAPSPPPAAPPAKKPWYRFW